MGDCVYTAFGLRCLAAAMKAKTERITRKDVVALIREYERDGFDDANAMAALWLFADIVDHDAPGAGGDLCDFLTGWRDGLIASQVSQVGKCLQEQDPTWGQGS